jgi:hypothetical protein
MKKRAFDRFPAELEVTCFDQESFGTVTNVSERGMFLKSPNITFPLDVTFDITIPLEDESVKVPVRVSRITRSNGYYDGMALELLNQPHRYLRLVQRLRLSVRNERSRRKGMAHSSPSDVYCKHS